MNRPPRTNAEKRLAIRTSEDARARHARTAVLAGARALIESGSDVTVASIVRAAGVSRAGFYKHFSGIDELAIFLMSEAFEHIADAALASRSAEPDQQLRVLRTSQVQIVDHYVENRGLYAVAAALPLSHEAYLTGVRAMADLTAPFVETHPNRPVNISPALAARVIAGGQFALLHAWVTGEVHATAEELVEQLMSLLPAWAVTPDLPSQSCPIDHRQSATTSSTSSNQKREGNVQS